ncbi:glycerate kinase [Niabella yanshanensis]|uniref:Glycerate kinase n=1 Tax=Niabella yanshanensis TaxID=577386 RepID=A0ABZ0W202_9BACT|nr:glycerate kinase [Niabella yanshanensis]WQD37298.1 glycerate kinase [Niabella yanshanensis]
MPSNKNSINILLAPNTFKNSLPANEVAAALAEGLKQSGIDATINCCPVGDGGDGTGKILALHLNAQKRVYKTVDPLGRPITAPVYYTSDHTAIIELSDASGLKLLQPIEYDPLQANTYGTGILIKKALDRKVKRILLAIGGSATVDGGTGSLNALGIQFLNREGIKIKRLPLNLGQLQDIVLSGMDARLQQTELIILCDVKNKLLGPNGAAKVFGPQKGATPANISTLEKSLKRLDRIIDQAWGIKISSLLHSGAAGGIAASMAALCNAKMVNGTDFFLDIIQFNDQLQYADIVITGEGSLDAQTLEGKAPLGVAQRAKSAGLKVIGVGGRLDPDNKKLLAYFDHLININPATTGLAKAITNTRANLVKTGSKIGALIKANAV